QARPAVPVRDRPGRGPGPRARRSSRSGPGDGSGTRPLQRHVDRDAAPFGRTAPEIRARRLASVEPTEEAVLRPGRGGLGRRGGRVRGAGGGVAAGGGGGAGGAGGPWGRGPPAPAPAATRLVAAADRPPGPAGGPPGVRRGPSAPSPWSPSAMPAPSRIDVREVDGVKVIRFHDR